MTDPAFWPWLLAAFLLGLVLGIGVAALLGRGQARRLMGVMGEAQRRHEAETDALLDGVKLAFHDIGRELAGASRDDMLRLAQTQLAGERRALGHTLEAERGELAARIATMLTQLERTQGLIRELERDRTGKFQALATQLRVAGDSAAELGRTTRHLARSLSGAKLRGQLGERLAEDVLKAMGLTPGIHYTRQAPLDAERRPDFLLALGDGRRLAMDVKFPLDNWRRAVEAADEETQARLEAQFMRDVRAHVAAVASRGYAAPELGTHDFALLFVPSDALLAAILDLAPDAIESAARQRVALVGPSTLYALLAALRMAEGEARLARAGQDLARAIGGFRLAWTRYAERAQRVERRLEDTLDELRKLYGLRRATVDRAMATVEAVLDGAPPEPDTADEPQDEAQGAAKSASFSGGRALTSE
ncbi:MAG: DNA recombination protein RmuC [Geminicoccaceae bacterium]|jgi:DNA recombination protein RmuC|nr:DNA recombination protein RmuC [Geminicoccaceae bacterium]